MAEDGTSEQNGVSLTGTTMDRELYGEADRFAGFDQSIGLDVEEEQDDRERALARCEAYISHFMHVHCCRKVLQLGAVFAARCTLSKHPKSSLLSYQTTKAAR